MVVLGIETSTKTGSVAIISERGVIAQYSLNIEVTHSERLMTTVDRVLKDTGIAMKQVDGFAVANGPGSFTGLRIGLSTVKGLSFATSKPVVTVPTLKALAWNVPYSSFPICPLLDARKNEVYAALYSFNGASLVQTLPEQVITLGKLAAHIKGKTVFTGEGAYLFQAEIDKLFGSSALFAPHSVALPSAAAVAEIGLDLLKKGAPSDPDDLTPMYIRRPEAEIAWERKQTSR